MKTIKLTPVGLTTTEGEQRVAKAVKAFEDSHATVANAATHFIQDHQHTILDALKQCDDDDAVEAFKELLDTIKDRAVAQEEFLRSLAGHPPMKVVTR